MPNLLRTNRFPCPPCERQGRIPADGVWVWATAATGEDSVPTCMTCGFYPKVGQPTPVPAEIELERARRERAALWELLKQQTRNTRSLYRSLHNEIYENYEHIDEIYRLRARLASEPHGGGAS